MRNECNQYKKASFDLVGDASPLVLTMNAGLTHINKEPPEATLLSPIKEFADKSKEDDSGALMSDYQECRWIRKLIFLKSSASGISTHK